MINLKTSSSSSILQNPAEHFTSLNSPSAQVRARQSSGDGMLASGDKQHASVGISLDVAGGGSRLSGRTRSGGMLAGGGGGGGARLPAAAVLRVGLWAVLHGCLVLATLKYLADMRKLGQDLYFLYYQPFLPMLAMLWFWALAVRVFERRRIRYDVCFSPDDQRFLLRSGQLFQICNVLTAVVLSSGFAFVYFLTWGQREVAAAHPPLLYAALLLLLLFPGGLLFRDARLFFGGTLWKVLTPGLRPVSWADFLLADILTSLAKALSDTERAVCNMMTGEVLEPSLQACSDASFIIPLGLAAPYAWRLVQCIRVYLDTGARPQLFNALKYSTAFPVILLSAVKYHVAHEVWRHTLKPLWLGAAFLNSAYSFYWDVERDWEISWFGQMGGAQRGAVVPSPVLRGQLLYRRPFYLYLMASNLALRLAWTYKLSPHLREHHVVVFFIVLAEAFRRFQWLFVRVEVELRKIQAHRPDLGVLVPQAGYTTHGHSSEAADSGSEEEGGEVASGLGAKSAARLLPVVPGHAVAAQHRAAGKLGGGAAEVELGARL